MAKYAHTNTGINRKALSTPLQQALHTSQSHKKLFTIPFSLFTPN